MARNFAVIALLASALLVGCASGTKHQDIAADALPAKVKAGFDKAHPGAKIVEAEKETYKSGVVHYEIKFTDKDGKKHEVELNESGEVLDKH